MKNAFIYLIIGLLFAGPVFMLPVQAAGSGSASPAGFSAGVWDNFQFNRTADSWATAASLYGGDSGIVDLVVAQADGNGKVSLSFPLQNVGSIYNSSPVDSAEPYLEKFDAQGLGVILSIQPLNASIPGLIDMILAQYGRHKCVIGINVDLEWKNSGVPQYVSNSERDSWLYEIKKYGPDLKLFLTYYGDHTHFPDDTSGLVVLFDGEKNTQTNLLNKYSDLAKYYGTVGIYTGYSSSSPPAASNDDILKAVPNTKYIIHTQDVFGKKTVIFELDDVQVGWLESTSIDLIGIHLKEKVPVVVGVIPNYLNNKSYPSYLPANVKDAYNNYSGLVEISQHGWTHNSSEQMGNQTYGQQEATILNGKSILESLGIEPDSFTPPYGSADNNTIQILEDNGYKNLLLYSWDPALRSSLDLNTNLMVLNSWTYLLDGSASSPTHGQVKSPSQLMKDIDASPNNVVCVLYHIQDFAPGSANSIDQLGTTLEALKSSGKYQFMTADEFHDALTGTYAQRQAASPTPTALPTQPIPQATSPFGLFEAMAVALIIISTAGLIYIGLWKRK